MSTESDENHPEKYAVRDLTPDTWKDFESFFLRYNGVQGGCWCVYYHRNVALTSRRMKMTAEENRDLKRDLVMRGRSRGILIYSGSRVVASCQYGTRDELPRVDGMRRYMNQSLDEGVPLWRLTCFFVDRDHRHLGLTRLALGEVIEGIRVNGGGILEAYPATTRRAVEIWFGPLKIFVDEGFDVVSQFGRSNVLVRKRIEGRKG